MKASTVSNESIGKRLLHVRETAQCLGLEVDTVYKKARLREVPCVKGWSSVAVRRESYRKGPKTLNRTFYRLRLLVLIALTTGMRIAGIFGLRWPDV